MHPADSISCTDSAALNDFAGATIHPAVPPVTIATLLIRSSIENPLQGEHAAPADSLCERSKRGCSAAALA
jgi:hypothetical protein